MELQLSQTILIQSYPTPPSVCQVLFFFKDILALKFGIILKSHTSDLPATLTLCVGARSPSAFIPPCQWLVRDGWHMLPYGRPASKRQWDIEEPMHFRRAAEILGVVGPKSGREVVVVSVACLPHHPRHRRGHDNGYQLALEVQGTSPENAQSHRQGR